MLALAVILLVALYGAMFATGDTSPQLGLDLRGGTQVTLTPDKQGQGKITKGNLGKAVDILRQRVNGIGVAESDVATEGNNIVISVPGKGRDQVLQTLGQTALLRFRQVLEEGAPTPATAAPTASATPKPSSSTNGRALSGALEQGAPSPSPNPTPTTSPSASPSAGTTTGPPAVRLTTLAQAQAFFASWTCTDPKPSDDQPTLYLVACDPTGQTKFLLDQAKVNGTDLKTASAGLPSNSIGGSEWEVDLSFKGGGSGRWGDLTSRVTKLPDPPSCSPPTGCNGVAIVLDGVVQSAPRIQEAILGGSAQITGSFTHKQADDLANVLKYGALPIKFVVQQSVTVSATLGSDQLHAGLLAGAIGLIAVVIYSFIYYRGLGLVTVASLILAGLYTYAAVVLLGSTISYTLTLAGIAGLIVAIGITADSFVVYFERLRDEVREGRTLRSAVERGWARAIRTILAADFVSLLAAAVLYVLSIGSVRGFAFTLGLSTLIDLVVVFIFTKPVVTLLVRGRLFGSGRPWTGLSPERLGVTAVRTEPEGRRRRVPRTGEA
jgi:preprotein translocase subunit SecD